jgi:hypothetical protein
VILTKSSHLSSTLRYLATTMLLEKPQSTVNYDNQIADTQIADSSLGSNDDNSNNTSNGDSGNMDCIFHELSSSLLARSTYLLCSFFFPCSCLYICSALIRLQSPSLAPIHPFFFSVIYLSFPIIYIILQASSQVVSIDTTLVELLTPLYAQ